MSAQEDKESEGEVYITDQGFVKRKRSNAMYPPPPLPGHYAMPWGYQSFPSPYYCTVPGHPCPPAFHPPGVMHTPYYPHNTFLPVPTPYQYHHYPTAPHNIHPTWAVPNYYQSMQPTPNYVPPVYPVHPQPQPQKAPSVQLHHYLDYYGKVPPRIVWDIIHPPRCAKVIDKSNKDLLTKVDLDLPAFKEPRTLKKPKVELATLSDVASSMLEAWGPIIVRKARPTILDVLSVIYDYWAQPLTTDDMINICQESENIERLKKAREERAKDGCEFEAVAMQGFKRSDILGGHRRFWGLRTHVDGYSDDGTCLLGVAIAPGPTLEDYWKW